VLAKVVSTYDCCVDPVKRIVTPSGEVIATDTFKSGCFDAGHVLTAAGGGSYRLRDVMCDTSKKIQHVDTKAVVGRLDQKTPSWPSVIYSVTYAQSLLLNEKLMFIVHLCMRQYSNDNPILHPY
jgi:hypothetical protein